MQFFEVTVSIVFLQYVPVAFITAKWLHKPLSSSGGNMESQQHEAVLEE